MLLVMCIDNANLILFDFWGLGLCNFFPCEKILKSNNSLIPLLGPNQDSAYQK